MAKPTNPVLATQFGRDVRSLKNAQTEVWSFTTEMLVPAGTNVEQLMADVMTGKTNEDPAVMGKTLAISAVDVTKVA